MRVQRKERLLPAVQCPVFCSGQREFQDKRGHLLQLDIHTHWLTKKTNTQLLAKNPKMHTGNPN